MTRQTAPSSADVPAARASVLGLLQRTEALVADAQLFLDEPDRNFGWVILGEEGEDRTAKRFDSRENPTPVNRPQLTVVYSLPGIPFVRGDTNADGGVDIADAVCTLEFLFGRPGAPCKGLVLECRDAADANDDGGVDIADAVSILGHLFGGTGELPAPAAACGEDPRHG